MSQQFECGLPVARKGYCADLLRDIVEDRDHVPHVAYRKDWVEQLALSAMLVACQCGGMTRELVRMD